jgi:long-chain acyl-CoA synthetase
MVVLRPGSDASTEELLDYCREYMAEYKVPSEIGFVDSLPKNMLGKVLRNRLRRDFLESHGQRPAAAGDAPG